MPQSPHWSWWWWWRRRQQCKWWRWFNCMNNQCIKIFSSDNIAIQCELKWILSTLIANRIEQCCIRTHLNWRLIPSADTSGRWLQNGQFSILFAKDFWVIQLACDGALWSFFANRIEKCSIRHTSTDDSSYLPTHRVDGSKMAGFQFCLQKTFETFNYHAMRLCATNGHSR